MFNLNLNINNIESNVKMFSLASYVINKYILKGEQHDRFSFIFHGMAVQPLVADRWRFCEAIHLSTMDSVGKTEKNKGQKAQRQKQSQKAQAIGVSICCNQTIKAS